MSWGSWWRSPFPPRSVVTPCRRRPDDRGKTLAAASVEMPPYGEPLRNAPTAPALMWERPARGWSLLPQNGDYK
jgi:hypothetical protein